MAVARYRTRAASALASVALVVAGCQTVPPSDDASPPPPTVSPSPTPTAAPVATAEVRADGLRLVASLPGSIGTVAFWGDLAVASVWAGFSAPSPDDGFIVVDIADPTSPREIGRFRCVGASFDLSIWDELVIVSQNATSAGPDCAAPATSPDDPAAFAGIRIVSIADPARPVQLAAVALGVDDGPPRAVRGSHTHTLVPDLEHTTPDGRDAPRLLVYDSDGAAPGAGPAATIVEVPLADPAAARVVGAIDPGMPAQCHDITVHLPMSLMACSAYEAGVLLFDISDPLEPELLSQIVDPTMAENLEIHHSTSFSNDGTTLVINPEIFTAPGITLCAGGTPGSLGALHFYDITDAREPVRGGSIQVGQATAGHFCYAHESNVLPIAGQDVLATGWFGAGVNLVDFSDPLQPRQVAHWISSGAAGAHSFAYAGYWYNGHVYAGNTTATGLDAPPSTRGLDVLAIEDPALASVHAPRMNAQTQEALPAR